MVSMEPTRVLWYGCSPIHSPREQSSSTTKHDPRRPLHKIPRNHLLTTPQYTAAAKQSALDPTARAITSLSNVMKSDPKLASLISAPTLQDSDKKQIVSELEKHTGGADKSGTVKNFLSTLAENNRLGLLEGACEKFGELISAGRGEMELVITSAAVRYPTSTFTFFTCVV
jgi:hypothetical protein